MKLYELFLLQRIGNEVTIPGPDGLIIVASKYRVNRKSPSPIEHLLGCMH